MRYFRLRESFLALLGISLTIPVVTSASTIGLYTDEAAGSCSFSGNDPGMVTAYIVVNPDAAGLKTVRFSAPVPSCLGATFLYDEIPDGISAIGSSPAGIALTFPFCGDQQALVLTTHYFRASSTDPCCEFPIEPDPFVGAIEAFDCSINPTPLTPVTSHFNADSSCPCGATVPTPYSPAPSNNDPAASVSSVLSWLPLESAPNVASYDLYLGTSPTPPFVVNVTQHSYQPPVPLAELTQYYWKIVVRDEIGALTPGPTWTFTTRAINSPPNVPVYTSPVNGATGIAITSVSLSWQVSSDVDNDPVEYDVYFGTASDPPLYASDLFSTTKAVPGLTYETQYWWRIVARDVHGNASTGPIFTFTTRPLNFPPNQPNTPIPANNTIGIGTSVNLSWFGGDPDGNNTVTYDVYLGTSTTPPLISDNQASQSKSVITLQPGNNYYWKVVATDIHGASAASQLWTFRTNAPPNDPTNPSPAVDATGVSLQPTLTWQGSDPDGDNVLYDVYWGTVSPPIQQRANLMVPSAKINFGITYDQTVYWRVRIRDEQGLITMGPIWTFHTVQNTAPTQASNPVPANNGYAGTTTLLQWDEASDAENPPRYIVYFGTENPPPYAILTFETEHEAGPFEAGVEYYWRVDVSDGIIETPGELWSFTGGEQPTAVAPAPTVLTLGRNHPNPFNPQTTIPYGVPNGAAQRVRLVIYDTSGRTVRVLVDEHQSGGMRDVTWNGIDDRGTVVSSGVYYCVLSLGDERRTQKLVLLK